MKLEHRYGSSLRADVSYFLCFTRKRRIYFLFPFPREAKEIGDVYTQASTDPDNDEFCYLGALVI